MYCLGVGDSIGGICGGESFVITLGNFVGVLADCRFFLFTLGDGVELTFSSLISTRISACWCCAYTFGDIGRMLAFYITGDGLGSI